MKIQELENELNISRANIRFYEKEGLLNPARKENGYRDYSNEDIAVLKKIIVYRKLGISVTDIKKIFSNELELQEAVSNSIENLQKEIEKLNGSIQLCKEIQKENANNNSFDEEHYWEEINYDEAKGNKFVDIYKDYIEFEKPIFHYISKYFLLI
ncbi:MAG: MerR family transcriptional regulator, partial [Eubacterium sp.]|nr:MerR family transcriptional regulator [Eubacterium sp.]